MFALVEIELMVQGIDLLFLLVEFFRQLVRRLLAFGSSRSGIGGGRLFGRRGVGVRGPLPSVGGGGGGGARHAQGFVGGKIVGVGGGGGGGGGAVFFFWCLRGHA